MSWREELHKRDRRGRFADVAAAGRVAEHDRHLVDPIRDDWEFVNPREHGDIPMPWEWLGQPPPPNMTSAMRRRFEQNVRTQTSHMLVRPGASIHAHAGRVTPEHMLHLADAFDRIERSYPHPEGRALLGIAHLVPTTRGGHDDGQTVPGRPVTRLHQELFTEPDFRDRAAENFAHDLAVERLRAQPGQRQRHRPATLYLPATSAADVIDHHLAHEWGHALPEPSAQRLRDMYTRYGHLGLTDYAYRSKSPHEAYAEAFAEWYLSGGQPTVPAVQAYADRFKWAPPRAGQA